MEPIILAIRPVPLVAPVAASADLARGPMILSNPLIGAKRLLTPFCTERKPLPIAAIPAPKPFAIFSTKFSLRKLPRILRTPPLSPFIPILNEAPIPATRSEIRLGIEPIYFNAAVRRLAFLPRKPLNASFTVSTSRVICAVNLGNIFANPLPMPRNKAT